MFQVACLGWTSFSTPLSGQHHTYHIDDTFCDSVHFREDSIFTWRRSGCDTVHAIVRHSFDAWQHNLPLSFTEVSNASDATILLSTSVLHDDLVGVARRRISLGDIELDEDTCWYSDRPFCHAVFDDRHLLHALLAVAWSLALVSLLFLLTRPLHPFCGATRIAVWSSTIAIPLVYFGSIQHCLHCYDLASVVVHEIGHVLGLGHSDDVPGATCGCGSNAVSCDTMIRDAMMHSVVQRRSSACLLRDDVDGVRTLYGTECSEPVWCYDARDPSGYARIAVSFLYAFFISTCVVGVRNVLQTRRRPIVSSSAPSTRPLSSPPPRPIRRPASSV